MTSFYDQPILNSPYKKPTHFHPLDEHGQPLDQRPVAGRRPSKFVVPVPKAKRKGAGTQGSLDLETYDDNAIINEIRRHVDDWRDLPGGADWGVTPTTQRLLEHWRHHPFANQKPFFCQIEAVETLVWLIEVARTKRQYAHLWRDIEARNLDANPDLLRLALKMATGAGKTTVMAMVIAWQTLNAVRAPGSDRFSKAFLIVTPGITIKDRLQVLLPERPDSYYKSGEIVPGDMLAELQKASIVITNYHSFHACCAAQMFLNEGEGDGVVFRGANGPWKTGDYEFHLKKDAAKALLAQVLATYEDMHGGAPKELFIHGQTYFNDEEWQAFCDAAPRETNVVGVRIGTTGGETKLFRDGDYPVLRGTALLLDEKVAYLWTTGYVPQLDTYIGPETPNPLYITVMRSKYARPDIRIVLADIMGLTKINYNSCNFNDGLPVTVRFARMVGDVLTMGSAKGQEKQPFKFYV